MCPSERSRKRHGGEVSACVRLVKWTRVAVWIGLTRGGRRGLAGAQHAAKESWGAGRGERLMVRERGGGGALRSGGN